MKNSYGKGKKVTSFQGNTECPDIDSHRREHFGQEACRVDLVGAVLDLGC